ncbi:SDR family oxidoreductase [Streptomyces sp. NPDC059443]|uniref:SDR family oxidoreductase n=1 Tax=Streptomyces sp. NPDC059443 TaxID=3346831 RepID=UPI0036B1932C
MAALPPAGDLSGRIALVTGGSRSLGAEIVRTLARRGAHVIVNYFHSVEQAGLLQAELEQAGYSCEFLRASVAKTTEIDRMFDAVAERHRGLDILVNNAAAGAFLPLLDIDDTYWERAWRTNVMGAYHCSRRAADLMSGRAGASILCLSSLGSALPITGYGATGVSKAGLEALVRYLAVELAPRGIRVNTLSLATVTSEIHESFSDPGAFERQAPTAIPLGRNVSMAEAAELVGLFVSDATGYITGQTITADGGLEIAALRRFAAESRFSAQARRSGPADTTDRPGARRPEEPALGDVDARSVAPAPGNVGARSEVPAPGTVPGPARSATKSPAAPGGVPIAVVGIGVTLPGSNSPQEFWQRLCEGTPLFSEPSTFRIDDFWSPDPDTSDRLYARRAGYHHGFVPDPRMVPDDHWDPGRTDLPQAVGWMRHCAVQALDNVTRSDGDRWLAVATGVQDLIGTGRQSAVLGQEYQELLRRHLADVQGGEWLAELAAHAISTRYDGDGSDPLLALPQASLNAALAGLVPDDTRTLVLDAACASGLYALDTAVKSLRDGSCDAALVGGSSVVEPLGLALFSKAQGITRSGQIRPFDQAADGTLIGEGAVMLTLKTEARARADGDRILGLVLGTGLAADGKGKAIHAPAERGQELAITRAWKDADIEPEDIDWIVAHGTATPVGDAVELRALGARLGDHARACLLTSNKSVVGHTGTLAGLVSVVHALLALEQQSIPGQSCHEAPHPLLSESRLTVPVESTAWAADPSRPRIVGVSAFGLGGTGAHAVLADRTPASSPASSASPSPSTPEAETVVVGWSTHLPGADPGQAAAWLRQEGPAPEAVFADPYPSPSPHELRIPPRTTAHMDHTQLMTLQAAGLLLEQLGPASHALKPTTAVIVGTALPMAHFLRLGLRVHAAECAEALEILPDSGQIEVLKAHLEEAVRVSGPEVTEDDFTGANAGLNSGRATNYHDLNGFGITVYGGRDSTHAAIDTGLRQLRHGACELALIGAVSGRPGRGWHGYLDSVVPDGRTVAEAAVFLAVARRDTAERHGLPIMGTLTTTTASAPDEQGIRGHELPALAGAERTYLAADTALAIVEAIHSGSDRLLLPDQPSTPALQFTAPGPTTALSHKAAPRPDEAGLGRRQSARLITMPTPRNLRQQPAIPDGAIVVTDDPELAARAASPNTAVWTPRPDIPQAEHVLPEDTGRALAELPFVPRHIRILSRLTAPTGPADEVQAARAESLMDLAFTTVQSALPALRSGGSLAALMMGALPDGLPHPLSGYFSGLIRSVRTEIEQCDGLTVLTSTDDCDTALRQLSEAVGLPVPLHTVARDGDTWLQYALTDHPEPVSPPDEAAAPLPPESVIVAFGGARGITSEILAALARSITRPTVYLVGRTSPPDRQPPLLPPQAEFMSAERRAHPDLSVAQLKARYDQHRRTAEAAGTIARLKQLCGEDRVHYRACDILDRERTTAVLDEIHDRHGRIDLLINGVLDLRSRALPAKPLADFQKVRATKAAGYRNLKHALAGRAPRIWCNFSSMASVTVVPGDADYTAASEYLNHATAWAHHLPGGHGEFAILWAGWRSVGVVATLDSADTLVQHGVDAFVTNEQGCAQFLSALTRPPRDPVLLFVRDDEQAMFTRLNISGQPKPHLPPAPPSAAPAGPATGPLLDGTLMRGRHWGVFTKTWEPRSLPEGDGRWLRHHLVGGVAEVAGTFVLEAAAEAAAQLRPDLAVVGFRDLVCNASITVRADRPRTIKTEAHILKQDQHTATVAVRITTNRVSATGKVLRFDDLCHRAQVLLSTRHPDLAAPPDPGPQSPYEADTLPIYRPNKIIHLSGPFAATIQHTSGPQGTTAIFDLHPETCAEPLTRLRVPALLLDAMGHLLALPRARDTGPLLGPLAGITTVDLATAGNDLDLTAVHKTIHLSHDLATGTLTAHTGDGTVLARTTGLTCHPTATLDSQHNLIPLPAGTTPAL